MTQLEQIDYALRQAGYGLTKSRRAVCQTLIGRPALTMAELIELCKPVDRASIYRTAELLLRLGLAEWRPIGNDYRLELSDQFRLHHHHLYCTDCGKIIDIEQDTKLEAWLRQQARQQGFELTSHQIELTGRCADCQVRLAESSE